MSKDLKTNEDFVNETIEVLNNNPEWKDIYRRYGEEIKKLSSKYMEKARNFNVLKPIKVYSSIGKVKTDSGTAWFDLRFAGQSIGKVGVDKKNNVTLSVTKAQAEFAKKILDFSDAMELENEPWDSKEARNFRSFFHSLGKNSSDNTKSPEHRIESYLLGEFSKTSSKDKPLPNIQPVRLGGKFFQLTTPVKASNHSPSISLNSSKTGACGGGIDILARVKHKKGRWRFAVMELKDENKESESQEVAMFQAITYATFLAKLFRSGKCGRTWWNILRNQSNEVGVPAHIDLDVVTVMPEGKSKEGCLDPIDVCDGVKKLNVTLHPYTLYYQVDTDGNPSSFSGTFHGELKK